MVSKRINGHWSMLLDLLRLRRLHRSNHRKYQYSQSLLHLMYPTLLSQLFTDLLGKTIYVELDESYLTPQNDSNFMQFARYISD